METVTLILTIDLDSPFAIRNVMEGMIGEMQAHTTAPITDFSVVQEPDDYEAIHGFPDPFQEAV